ncbi:MAG: DUF2269 family protein [Candidatus Acidiferrum sp.]|jgi:hypothetical protein
MSPYPIALFTHFLGLVGLFVGYGLEWASSSLLRRSTTSDQARSWLRIYKLSLPISGPGLLILIISGGYMASNPGAMKQGWISASLLAIVVALAIGFILILPRIKRIRAALPEGSAALPEAVLVRVQDPMIVTLVRTRLVLALGIVYIMTAKPGALSNSLFILLGAVVIGLLCAAPVWTSRPKPA